MAAETSLSQAHAARAVDAVLTAVSDTLVRGESVGLARFGVPSRNHRAGRQGRTPGGGASIPIAAFELSSFKAGKALRDGLN